MSPAPSAAAQAAPPKDDAAKLGSLRQLSLEEALEYIQKDELVEITPKAVPHAQVPPRRHRAQAGTAAGRLERRRGLGGLSHIW